MSKKTTIAIIAALSTLSFGTAYAAGETADKAANPAVADPSGKKFWTREEALQYGFTEEQIKAMDTNADGKIDVNELAAAAAKDQAAK